MPCSPAPSANKERRRVPWTASLVFRRVGMYGQSDVPRSPRPAKWHSTQPLEVAVLGSLRRAWSSAATRMGSRMRATGSGAAASIW